MLSPFDIGMRSPFGPPREWWGYSAGLGDLAYDMCNGRFMQGGTSANQSDVLTEGRTTDAYVLDGFGEYVLRSYSELVEPDFMFDPKSNKYIVNGVEVGIDVATTESRTTDAYVLDGDGEYVKRYRSRTNLCLNKDFTALDAGVNTVVTHMPLEPGKDGKLGNVYRVQFPAITATNIILANVTGGIHTVSLNVKEFDLVNNQFGLFTPGGNPSSANYTASPTWQRVTLIPTTPAGDIFLLNPGDIEITDILVEKPSVIEGVDDGPYIETTGTAVTVPAEPAQANGHGLDGFDESVNLVGQPDLSDWQLFNITRTLNADIAPDGTMTATRLSGLQDVIEGRAILNSVPTSTDDHIFSPLVKGVSGETITLEVNSETQQVTFDGTWQHFSVLNTDGLTARTLRIINRAGDTADIIEVWAAQLTEGTVVYPPNPAGGTRGADDTRVKQGEGQELVVGGTFDTLDAAWIVGGVPTVPITAVGGKLRIEGNGFVTQAMTTVAGATYTLVLDIDAADGNANQIRVGTTANGSEIMSSVSTLGVGQHTIVFVATGTTTYYTIKTNYAPASNDVSLFDNATVKAVTIAPGITANPNELTFRVDWDGVAVDSGTFRNLFEVKNPLEKQAFLIIRGDNNELQFGGKQSGVTQKITAGASFDDGLPHSVVCYFNRTTSLFKMSVDGAAIISATLTGAVPPNLNDMAISGRATSLIENLSGTNTRLHFSEGDKFDEFLAKEPAQADGHGLDGFEELDNYVKESRGILGADGNPTPVPVASSVITPFKDTGAWTWAVGTNGSKRQTNSTVPAVAGVISYSFIAIVGGAGAQVRDAEGTGLAGGDRDPFTFDFDTLATLTGHGPDVVQTLSPNRYRLIFFYTNTGAETTAVSILHPFVNATKDNVSFDQFQWTMGEFVPPVIVTTGLVGTRGADDTRIKQGAGPELITGDRDDFTGSTVLDGATVTADQLGTADLVVMSANVNARALYRPVATLDEGVVYRFMIELRSVSGSGLYPLAATDGNSIVSGQLVSLTEEWSTHFIDILISAKPWAGGTPGIYIGNRRDVVGETLTSAYVRQGSITAETLSPGFSTNPDELTFRVDWDDVAVDADTRILFEIANDNAERVVLLLNVGNRILFLAADKGGFQSINAGASLDDGGAHTAIFYVNQATDEVRLSVDGGATISGTLTGAVPANLNQVFIGVRRIGTDNANGINCQVYVSEGDRFEEFKDSSAGFF